MFIALEGPDGSGKSTMIKGLEEYFKNKGMDIVVTREPGGTPIGEAIRRILLDNRNKNMLAETEALLYAASRGQHVMEKILPAIKAGKMVLCDRFILSSLAYQGVGRGLGIEEVRMINDFAIKGIRPDLTLFYHVDPETTLHRKTRKRGGDRLEKEGADFHRKVYHGYLEILEKYSNNVKVIDATKSKKEVLNQSIYCIEEFLKGRKKNETYNCHSPGSGRTKFN
ncbi:MAG: dTMP kinase [Tissierellia bacterium]|nr:dTMP kinase [Tissierellia bacterium]